VTANAPSNGSRHSPPTPKPREQDGRGDIDPGTREWWERFWTDALKRLKRYLEEA
jgi:hypothetical protein